MLVLFDRLLQWPLLWQIAAKIGGRCLNSSGTLLVFLCSSAFIVNTNKTLKELNLATWLLCLEHHYKQEELLLTVLADFQHSSSNWRNLWKVCGTCFSRRLHKMVVVKGPRISRIWSYKWALAIFARDWHLLKHNSSKF